MDAYRLLLVMSRPESGISDYWRTRIRNLIDQIPKEPRVYAEVVEDEPVVEEDVALANVVIAEAENHQK